MYLGFINIYSYGYDKQMISLLNHLHHQDNLLLVLGAITQCAGHIKAIDGELLNSVMLPTCSGGSAAASSLIYFLHF